MRSIQFISWLSVCIALAGCIGVDHVDDPLVGERIEIEVPQVALQPGETHLAQAMYFDQYGVEKNVNIVWTSSSPAVASVDQQGLITALSGGQAVVVASVNATQNQIAVNVVVDDSQVASVVITSPGNQTSLQPGEMVTLTSLVKNIKGDLLNGRTIEWFSENSSLAIVSNQGVVTGIGSGMVDIHAKVEGVKSNILTFSSGGGRSGMFVSSGGYKAVGTASLRVVNGKLTLEFSSNFETSFALGTYVYLANSTNGSQVRANGLEIAQITTNGTKTFDISAINPGIGLFDYKYAIILCKPATVTFGYAELK
jgi:hypothetical protein